MHNGAVLGEDVASARGPVDDSRRRAAGSVEFSASEFTYPMGTGVILRTMTFVALGASSAAVAHHSFAMFDMQQDRQLHGVAKSFTWQSPHSWLQMLVKDGAGKPVEWSIEMGAPNMLYKRGLRPASVKSGDVVTLVVHPLRDGRAGGSLVSVVLADGTKLQIGGGAGGPAPAK